MNKPAARILVVLLAGAALAAQAADLLDDVKARGTLRIGMEGTYPPFNYKNDKGELDGFDVDIAKALAAKLGVKPEFTTTEWSAILAGLQAGKYDVIVNQVAATDKRRETFDFSAPYVVSYPQLIVRANETRKLDTVADLKGKKIGVGQGSNYADLAKSIEGAEVRTYPGATEYLQDLATGRIDAAINDSLLIPYLREKTKLPVKAGAPIGKAESNAIPFRKGNPKFKQAIDKAPLSAAITLLRVPVALYMSAMRGTPLLVQVFIALYLAAAGVYWMLSSSFGQVQRWMERRLAFPH